MSDVEPLLIVEMSDLQEQMGRLGDTALVGGERTDATEHLVAGIARLNSEVNDASSYLPAYDQRTYGEVQKLTLLVMFWEGQNLMCPDIPGNQRAARET